MSRCPVAVDNPFALGSEAAHLSEKESDDLHALGEQRMTTLHPAAKLPIYPKKKMTISTHLANSG